ncbi:MAG: hypothetical protein DCC71_07820 [Proteobacteria bacterium]|nr:MAG: hypothetical protein DCC71_07820 [Pseudomonadota bacterium]
MISSLHVLRAPVADFLTRLSLGPRQSHASLALWPLVLRTDTGASATPPFVPLADAVEADALRVDEVSPGGMVPHVRVENDGDTAVLVLFGEELRGAKQIASPTRAS